jgi:hypothetical protein
VKLVDALPDLVLSLESPLAHLGRGDLIGQLQEAEILDWRYDDHADTTTLRFPGDEPLELLSLYDEAGVNLETDERGRLVRMEVLGGKAVAEQLAT